MKKNLMKLTKLCLVKMILPKKPYKEKSFVLYEKISMDEIPSLMYIERNDFHVCKKDIYHIGTSAEFYLK